MTQKCYWCYHWFDCDKKENYREAAFVANDCPDYMREPGADDDIGEEAEESKCG